MIFPLAMAKSLSEYEYSICRSILKTKLSCGWLCDYGLFRSVSSRKGITGNI